MRLALFLSCKGDSPPAEVRGNPGSVDVASSRKMSLTLIVAVSLMIVIAFSCTIIFVYLWRRKMANRQGNCFAGCTPCTIYIFVHFDQSKAI